jgi:aryl-alcohol dehydrogenase-like predicted oxidoreductase
MEKIKLPGIPVEASRIGLGTWAIGGWMWGGSDEEPAMQTLELAFEKGINFWDTAPVYGFGRAEEILGKVLKRIGKRDEIIIATKCGLDWSAGQGIQRNASRARILEEVDDSLRRLGTDRIDLMQVHWPNPSTPAQETAEALLEAQQQGKILALGVSNYSPRQMDDFRRHAPLVSNQPPYNLFERDIEAEVLPYCKQHDVAVITYGALCRGLLSGRISMATHFEGDDLRQYDPKFQRDTLPTYLQAVRLLDELAQRHGRRVLHLAVRWLLDQPGISVALWGARRPEQLETVEQVLDWHITPEMSEEIDHIIKQVGPPLSPEWMAPALR